MDLSASPFDAVWYGEDHRCLMPFVFANSAKSTEKNCGPLSDTICSGIPWVANKCRSTAVVLAVEVHAHLECASTTMKSDLSKNGTAKATWIHCHGRLGHILTCQCTLASLDSKDARVHWQVTVSLPGMQSMTQPEFSSLCPTLTTRHDSVPSPSSWKFQRAPCATQP